MLLRGRAPLAVAMTASARPNKVLTPRTTVARSKSGVFGRNIMYFRPGCVRPPYRGQSGGPQKRLNYYKLYTTPYLNVTFLRRYSAAPVWDELRPTLALDPQRAETTTPSDV